MARFGDGRTDVIRKSHGTCLSQGTSFSCNASHPYQNTGTPSPLVGDYNGDGLDDYLTPHEDEWRLCRSVLVGGAQSFSCRTTVDFAQMSELKTGDFDADGRTDIYRKDTKAIYYGDATESTGFKYPGHGVNFATAVANTPIPTFSQLHLLDINGDGATDVLGLRASDNVWFSCTEATGTIQEHAITGFACRTESSSGLPSTPYNSGDPFEFSIADFNADGLADVLFYNTSNNKWRVWYSNGHESDNRFTSNQQIAGFGGTLNNHLVADLNGDGSADVARWMSGSDWQVAYSAAGPSRVIDNVNYTNPGAYTGKITQAVAVGDFDGDGRRDMARAVVGQVGIHLSEAYSAPLLHDVTSHRSTGNKITLDLGYGYTTKAAQSASIYPNRVLYNTHVVTSSKVPGTRSGEFDETTYDFDKLTVNKQGLGILGFNIRAETDQRRKLKTTYFYHQKFPFVGRLAKVVKADVKSSTPRNQQVKFYSYSVQGKNYEFTTGLNQPDIEPTTPVPDRYWVYARDVWIDQYDYHTNTHLSRTKNVNTYSFNSEGRSSDYGRVRIHKKTTLDKITNKFWVETTTNVYLNKPGKYLMGLLQSSTLHSNGNGSNSGGAVSKVRDYRYNGNGQIDRVILEPQSGAALRPEYLRTEYLYDGYGNVRKETTVGNKFGNQTLPNRITNTTTTYRTAGQPSITGATLSEAVKREVITNAEGHTMTMESSLDHGQPLYVKDINDLNTVYVYDEFGQKPKVTSPDNTYTQVIKHDWVANNDANKPAHAEYYKETVFEREAANDALQPPVKEYFDAHGNLLRSMQERWSSSPVIIDYTYDALGRLTHETTPYYQGGGFRNTLRAYVDNTDQLASLIDHRGPSQSYVYDRYTTTRTDSDGHMHREKRNAKGQVILVEEGGTGNNQSTVTYRYDDAGRIKHVIDDDGNTTSSYYDSRDNRTILIDPDLGRIDYRYDSYGAVVWQRNARMQVTTMSYDKLGRLMEQRDPDSIELHTYDTQANGEGKLALVTYRDPGESTAHYKRTPTYDAVGRLSSSTECIDAVGGNGCTNFTTGYQYDSYSRLAVTTLPGGKQVAREYRNNILNAMRRGVGGPRIWQVNNMDARGRPYVERAGNGVFTRYTYDFANQQGGMMSSIRVHKGSPNLMHRKYTYQPSNAQLASREDVDFNYTEAFTYDLHRRVKTSQITNNGTLVANHTYDYDKLGNIKVKPDQAETLNKPYTYGGGITVNGAGPHAIKSLGNRNFSYDASGNLLNDGLRTVNWKSFQKPSSINKGSATIWFEYGAGNHRLRRRQGNFNTWYHEGGPDVKVERLTHNNNNNVTTKYHYLVDGRVVGIDEETASGTTERYLHSDRMGSASVLTDVIGNVVERMSYDIWGQVRPLSGGSNSTVLKSAYHTKSYTGHEALADVDLVHMNGRVYDPILGRFMSADPFVQYIYNSQSFNRYSYVLNNPLGATDPSGYTEESVDGGGGVFGRFLEWAFGDTGSGDSNGRTSGDDIGGNSESNVSAATVVLLSQGGSLDQGNLGESPDLNSSLPDNNENNTARKGASQRIGSVEFTKAPGASDADVVEVMRLWEKAKTRRLADGSIPKSVNELIELENSVYPTVIAVGDVESSAEPWSWDYAKTPGLGSPGNILFNPTDTRILSDGTINNPESSLVHEAAHVAEMQRGELSKFDTTKTAEISATSTENYHRKAMGLKQRTSYGGWSTPTY